MFLVCSENFGKSEPKCSDKLHAFFYKQHFYKKHHAEIDKKFSID